MFRILGCSEIIHESPWVKDSVIPLEGEGLETGKRSQEGLESVFC
jgi:hypothetical protein